jgi:hypothetical protein
MLIAEIYNVKINEDASAGATSSGVIASVNFPMFTGKRGKAHHKTARKAIDPKGYIFKKETLTKEPYKMGHSPDTLAYTKKVKNTF